MAVDAHQLQFFMRNSEIMNAFVIASDSGVAVNEASAPPRKRQRNVVGGDVCLQIQQQQQQLEIERLIANHAEKVRLEMAERRKRLARHILAAVEEGVSRRLRAKEEEIERIGRLNWALEERVKSLSVENQVWREMAQRSEAAATEMRSNLEQVLASAATAAQDRGSGAAEDAESCCGDSEEEKKRRMRRCWRCGEGEAAVLLMPCRHLCVCAACISDVEVCPVCKCRKHGGLVVNLP